MADLFTNCFPSPKERGRDLRATRWEVGFSLVVDPGTQAKLPATAWAG